jgi:hypothetical protein
LEEFMTVLKNKECERCLTRSTCYITNEQSVLCPCKSCLIKIICEQDCRMFNDFVDSFTTRPNEAKLE